MSSDGKRGYTPGRGGRIIKEEEKDWAQVKKETGAGAPARKRRKKRRSLKQVFEYLLSCQRGEEAVSLAAKEGAIISRDITVNEAIAAIQVAKAMKGDAKAFELIRNTIGEKPADKGDIDLSAIPKIVIVRREEK